MLSYLHKPRSTPFLHQTIPDYFRHRVKEHNGEAFVYHKSNGTREAMSYGELKVKSERFAHYLVRRGIGKGERIAICGKNTMNWIIGEMGILMSGGVSLHITVNEIDSATLSSLLELTECKAVLFDTGENGEYRDVVTNLTQSANTEKIVTILLRHDDVLEKFPNVSAILGTESEELQLPVIFPEDPAVIFDTSGSSGESKFVEHTHFNLINSGKSYNKGNPFMTTYNDRPFGWALGSPLIDIIVGQKRIYSDILTSCHGSSIEKIWSVIKAEKCDTAFLMPFSLYDLLDLKETENSRYQLQSLSTGGYVPQSSCLNVLNVFTKSLVIVYGSTETLFATMREIRQPECAASLENVGSSLEGIEIKVVDNAGNITDRGVIGQIYIRSLNQLTKYINNDEATKNAFGKGGWFKMGDTGCISVDGDVIIKGRTKDIISRGARKIIPQSIEKIIHQLQGIQQAVVIGVPDDRLHEEICACFVSEKNNDSILENIKQYCEMKFCSNDSIDGIGEMPKYFLQFEDFPKLPNGKIDKLKIRAMALSRI